MKYYIIAGEASGDLHGSNLIKSLQKKDQNAMFQVWGGDLMEATGAKLVKHYKDLAFMGFVEVLKNLKTILKNISFCKKNILEFQPDVLILIDYPGFNLRIADWAKKNKIKVFYYISPQIWAWHTSRVHKIKENVERMFVILPFEKDFYKKYDYEVDYVGHPLLDAINNFSSDERFFQKNNIDTSKKIIAILPGSRKQEISKLLPEMLSVVADFQQFQFVIAGAPSMKKDFYAPFLQGKNIKIVFNETYNLLKNAHAALVTSGTATLETALFNVPEVVCYKGSNLSYQIAKRLVDIKYISLVNLILDEKIVSELIQNECTAINIKTELSVIIDGENRKIMLEKYKKLHSLLGKNGASDETATLMYQYLQQH